MAVRTEFRLLPSRAAFSKVNLDLFFEDHQLNSTTLALPQSMLLSDILEFTQILDMKGIRAGTYLIRVEMYEPWSSGEKLNFTSKELLVQYVPKNREERLVKIPTVKSVAGSDLMVVSSSAKNVFREIEEDQKQESMSKRDEW